MSRGLPFTFFLCCVHRCSILMSRNIIFPEGKHAEIVNENITKILANQTSTFCSHFGTFTPLFGKQMKHHQTTHEFVEANKGKTFKFHLF